LRRTLVLATALLTVLAGAVVAAAAIPDGQGVIHACRSLNTGALRVIDTDSGQTCNSKNEAALTWSQAGPQGPAGPPGPAGGVSGAHIVSVQGPGDFPVQVLCPSGETALSVAFSQAASPTRVFPVTYSAVPVFDGERPIGYDARADVNALSTTHVTCAPGS
jgi:hypothetical protein